MAAARWSIIRPRSAPAMSWISGARTATPPRRRKRPRSANRFDRDVVALTTLTTVANAYFQVLAAQDRHPDRAAQHCQRRAYSQCHPGPLQGRHRQRPRRRAAGKRGRQPARAGAAAAADARPEHQRAGDAGLAAAGSGARHRRVAQPDRLAARHARPAVGIADAASRYSSPGISTRLGDRQCRQRPRAVFPEHSINGTGRLSELGAVGAVSAERRVLQHGRQPDPADLRRRQDPRQFRIHQGAAGRIAADLPQDRGAVVCRCRQCA